MRIPHGAPAKPREPGAPGQLSHGPHCSKASRQHGGTGMAPTPEDGSRKHVIETQRSGQGNDGDHRQQGGQATVGVQRNEQPPKRGAEPDGGKRPGQARRSTRTGGSQQRRYEDALREELQPPQGSSSVKKCIKRPCSPGRLCASSYQYNSNPRPGAVRSWPPTEANCACRHAVAASAAGDTLNHFTAPPLVCKTRKSRPPRL